MNQPFDTIDINKRAEVNYARDYTFDRIANFQRSKTCCQAVFDGLFLGENQFVSLAVAVQNTHFHRPADQRVQAGENFVLVGAANARIMLGAQLRYRQEAAYALVLDQQSAAVRVVRRNLDNFSSIKVSLNFFPAAVFGCLAQTQQAVAVIKF